MFILGLQHKLAWKYSNFRVGVGVGVVVEVGVSVFVGVVVIVGVIDGDSEGVTVGHGDNNDDVPYRQ